MLPETEETLKHPKVVIIGAGFSGICAGIKLQTELGIYDYLIIDENHDVGGTWLTHTYPGCACDVASHLYSYSFELNPNWSTSFATQPEILAYLKGVAYKYDLYSKIKFQHQAKSATWDEKSSEWRIVVHDKLAGKTTEYKCDIVISGVGGLRVPNSPEIFTSKFKGPIIHSAKWDSSVRLEDKTVAVIGSGCSAVQIIPMIEPVAKRLLSFQRRPAWVVPLTGFQIFGLVQWLFNKIPWLMWLYRMLIFFTSEAKFIIFKAHSRVREMAKWAAHQFLKWQIPYDPKKRQKLMPNYEFACKRVSPSNVYYKALAKTKCDVITEKITSVTKGSIITENGKEYPIDVLILATGYRVQDFFSPLKLYGINSEDILETWRTNSPSHYLGIMGSKTPNAFSLLGPNTAYGHNSVIFSIECQASYVMQVLAEFIKRNAKMVVVKESVENEYMTSLAERFKDTVWGTNECGSWYVDRHGMNTTLYPGSLISYWSETRKPVFSNLSFY